MKLVLAGAGPAGRAALLLWTGCLAGAAPLPGPPPCPRGASRACLALWVRGWAGRLVRRRVRRGWPGWVRGLGPLLALGAGMGAGAWGLGEGPAPVRVSVSPLLCPCLPACRAPGRVGECGGPLPGPLGLGWAACARWALALLPAAAAAQWSR
jgi:hypothetical protein